MVELPNSGKSVKELADQLDAIADEANYLNTALLTRSFEFKTAFESFSSNRTHSSGSPRHQSRSHSSGKSHSGGYMPSSNRTHSSGHSHSKSSNERHHRSQSADEGRNRSFRDDPSFDSQAVHHRSYSDSTNARNIHDRVSEIAGSSVPNTQVSHKVHLSSNSPIKDSLHASKHHSLKDHLLEDLESQIPRKLKQVRMPSLRRFWRRHFEEDSPEPIIEPPNEQSPLLPIQTVPPRDSVGYSLDVLNLIWKYILPVSAQTYVLTHRTALIWGAILALSAAFLTLFFTDNMGLSMQYAKFTFCLLLRLFWLEALACG